MPDLRDDGGGTSLFIHRRSKEAGEVIALVELEYAQFTVPEQIPGRGQRAGAVEEAITIVAAHAQHQSHSASLDARERQQACLSTVVVRKGS